MVDNRVIQIERNMHEKFLNVSLINEWYQTYRHLFDEQDFHNASNQKQHHFLEWACAIIIYHENEWLSLIEKYGVFKERGRKYEVITRFRSNGLISDDLYHLMKNPSDFGFPSRQQCPDLFVYSSDFLDFRFVETKWIGEKLHGMQREYFAALSEISNKPVEIIRFEIK